MTTSGNFLGRRRLAVLLANHALLSKSSEGPPHPAPFGKNIRQNPAGTSAAGVARKRPKDVPEQTQPLSFVTLRERHII